MAMVFDFSAGLSLMGEAVSKTAGAYTLEAQRAEAQKEMMVLADQMAGARDEKQRTFQSSERVAGQEFQSKEKGLDRTQAEKLAQLQADTAIRTAGISAGASTANTQANIAAQAADTDKKLAANKPLVDAEVLAKTVETNAKNLVVEARKELQTARETGDAAKIKAAQQKEFDATYSSQAHVQQVSVYQAQAKILGDALQAAQTRLVAMQDPMKMATPEGKAMTQQLEAQVRTLNGQYLAAVRQAEDAMKNLPAYTPGSTTGPDLSKYLRTTPAPPTSQAPAGMINQPVMSP